MATRPGSNKRMYGWDQPKPHGQAARGRLSDLYNTNRWRKESSEFKKVHPLCAECLRHTKIVPSEVTDHIIPHPLHDFWDQHNWQALCRSCNNSKGNKDKEMLNAKK